MAPTKMKKSMPLVSAVRSTTSRSVFHESLRFTTASRTAPKAPTPAASVGVAQPRTIEPSTSRMRKTAGMKPRSISRMSSGMLFGPISLGSGGARCGLNRHSVRM